jgi:hypothetical protein
VEESATSNIVGMATLVEGVFTDAYYPS